ncbi:hypothetical protein FPK43_21610, partial [Acinetobacter baumannii]|nr:hypothetical protein [Acinetobacter baumannii]
LNSQHTKNIFLQQIQINNNLPFNVIVSDDGWLRKSALLSSQMNDDIVKRLRNTGWQCHSFSEPEKEGEFITIQAFKNGRNIKIALLYCCDTCNKIYKELEKTCDYI